MPPEGEEDTDKKVQWKSSASKFKDNETAGDDEEEDEKNKRGARDRVSAGTQYSDQGLPRTQSAATQWSPIDSFTAKTIPGYTGHLPGRHYVTPGKTFRQEMDSVLANFHAKSKVINPLSRHMAPNQQPTLSNEPECTDDPYFDRRPPSTYLRNYNPIPGYQGFVPRVRTSTSSLGIRYTKAVERSLQALHDKQQALHDKQLQLKASVLYPPHEDMGRSPQKLLDQRPLHTPRHRPHPHHDPDDDEDWMACYKRPPSTYLTNGPTYIPGYKGFVPHLRESARAIGVRYSKAALMCLESSRHDKINRPRTYPADNDKIAVGTYRDSQLANHCHTYNDRHLDAAVSDRYNRNDRPYRQEHVQYLSDRRPSTYMTDERHPIPGYQGFIPRMRDSPSTLGLRYTKAAVKTLKDLHRSQREIAGIH